MGQGNQQKLFEAYQSGRYDHLSCEEHIELHKIHTKAIEILRQDMAALLKRFDLQGEELLLVQEQAVRLRREMFGRSSEKQSSKDSAAASPAPRPKAPRVQRLSERYPGALQITEHVELESLPDCRACGEKMSDSGMRECSQYLTVIPKQFWVIHQERHKYRCGKCHGDVITAPCPPRIKPGSSYSDKMILDVALSKYCDLIPINRYVRMAEREGVEGLPPQSLIEATHHLADFLEPVHDLLKAEIKSEKVLHADETSHRMLEGSQTQNWHLWGFSGARSSYFEAHDTRSGEVASSFLKDSACEFLMSDVYSGYGKAVREANHERVSKGLASIQGIYCNAHARRRFTEACERFPTDAAFFIESYQQIYHLESQVREGPADGKLQIREQMRPYFDSMKKRAIELVPAYPEKSYMGKALCYFLGNYEKLTLFTTDIRLPIDNNSQERLLRNPVIGRKTWYGTHSKRGAQTMALLFSVIESCKLNAVNPREYLPKLVADMHRGIPPYTPASFKTTH